MIQAGIRVLSFTVLTLIVVHTYSQKLSCDDFKEGEFKIYSELGTSTILRKGNKQFEIMNGEPGDSFKIEWIDTCSYMIRNNKSQRKRLKEQGLPTDDLRVNIIDVGQTSAIIEITQEGLGFAVKAEMIKVE